MSKKSKAKSKANTTKALATQSLKYLHTHPLIMHTPFNIVARLADDLRQLSEVCDDSVRVAALEAAAEAAERLTSNELMAALAALADVQMEGDCDAPWAGEQSDCDRRYLEARGGAA